MRGDVIRGTRRHSEALGGTLRGNQEAINETRLTRGEDGRVGAAE
jgi:hypothetical protein